MSLSINQFEEFFGALNQDKQGNPLAPFPWQSRLAKLVFESGWPECIDLPTASGKTACIDIAVFVLACQAAVETSKRTVGRRIFFTVNRRVIVDEAFDRAFKLAERLRDAKDGILKEVAAALHEVSGDEQAPPLDVAQLRGGIYRDRAWARSITQPIVVCTTADQLGSRLLFRGYGVSASMQPVHAALTACDSLILLDEAHVTRAFCQTLRLLTKYQSVRTDIGESIPAMRFVQMTATPVDVQDRFELDEADRSHPVLAARQNAPKLAELIKLGRKESIADKIVARALGALSDTRKAVGIMVNRVRMARDIEKRIRAEIARRHKKEDDFDAECHLVIGRMRPIDRDKLQEHLRTLVGPDRRDVLDKPVFIVATQCLEVGADYDFDALITECASIDALRQRFGRLNRKGRLIEAEAAIVTNDEAIKGADPIYGDAIKHTWEWLWSNEGNKVDFGIAAFKPLWWTVESERRTYLEEDCPKPLLSPTQDAAVLLPAHLDALCQTNPRPVPSPDVSYFIHGPKRDMAEVNVCWRADLGDEVSLWPEIVRLLPPTTPECMAVPLWEVRRWITGVAPKDADNRDADVAVTSSEESEPDPEPERPTRRVVVWRGSRECDIACSPSDLQPGDTIVIRTKDFGWETFGHIPAAPTPAELDELHGKSDEASTKARAALELRRDRTDVAELATRQTKLRVVERIRPVFDGTEALRGLSDPALRQVLLEQNVIPAAWGHTPVAKLERHHYPDSNEEPPDEVIVFKRLLDLPGVLILPPDDEDDGEDNLSERDRPLSLEDHTRHVIERVDAALHKLNLNGLASIVRDSARHHDLGKADVRFQAMLAGVTPYEAMMRPKLLGKGDGVRRSLAEKQVIFDRAMYPRGFRHEMLSVELIEHLKLEANVPYRDLLLHLVAAHHGYARPFAPVCFDDTADNEIRSVRVYDHDIDGSVRKTCTPSHRLDSGVAERFWKLTRQHGWWGLAWLESILRLADQQASAAERGDEQ